jgi:hypothetical protein
LPKPRWMPPMMGKRMIDSTYPMVLSSRIGTLVDGLSVKPSGKKWASRSSVARPPRELAQIVQATQTRALEDSVICSLAVGDRLQR